MIDPDSIILAEKNNHNELKINSIPEYDFMTWDLEDEKELKKYYKVIESTVRKSFEYKEMINYLRDNYNMNECSFIKVSNKDSYSIRIELHHYPFTLYDIVQIVYRKRIYYGESLETEMVSKEIVMLHYKLLIGLIPLSETVHQLVHDGKLFIPVENVLGRYKIFVELYKPFCEPEQLETLERIENYSETNSDLCNTSILDMNTITFSTTNKEYQLPDLNMVENNMYHRISDIKQNNYMLPTIDDYKDLGKKDDPKDRRSITKPIYFMSQEEIDNYKKKNISE
jgi:hypothetical protein